MAYTSCSHNDTGYLELFIGPMFSGKTSKLLEIYKQYKFCSIPIAVINHSADVRYHESHLSTHDKIMIPCIQSTALLPLCNHIREENDTRVSVNEAKVILINEGQFFEDLYEFTLDSDKDLNGWVESQTKNWESDRLAMTDFILLKMAVAEMIKFPSIPVKVSINEYIELAKNYSKLYNLQIH